MLNTILLIFFLGSCAGILVIVIRKFPQVARLDVSLLVQERETELKKKLLFDRLVRKFSLAGPIMKYVVRPVARSAGMLFRRAWEFVRHREQWYRILRLSRTNEQSQQQSAASQQVAVLSALSEIEALMKEGKHEDAEHKLIELIALEPKNAAAYRTLADVYVQRGEYESAREVFEHILKIDDAAAYAYAGLGRLANDAGTYERAREYFEKSLALDSGNVADMYALGKIYETLGDTAKALALYQSASAKEPNNPKYIDKVIEIAILLKKKAVAKQAFLRLKKANPENEKLEELSKRIEGV